MKIEITTASVFWLIILFFAFNYLREKNSWGTDDSDKDSSHRSGMIVRTDYKTGLHSATQRRRRTDQMRAETSKGGTP